MKKNRGMIAIMVVGLFAATAQATGLELTTRDASGGDASLHENVPTSGNDDSTVTVRSRLVSGSERHSASVFRFGVAELNVEATRATLKFDVTTADDDSFEINVFGLVDGTTKGSYTDADWPEAFGVTYNTMPGFSGDDYPNIDRDHVPGETVLLGTINYAAGTLGEISMASTPALVDFINADTNGVVTIFIEAQVAITDQDFFIALRSNKNSINGAEFYPTLSIETDPPPFNPVAIITTADAGGGDANLNENIPNDPNNNETMTLRSRLIAGTERHSAVACRFGLASLSGIATNVTLKFYTSIADSDSFSINVYGVEDGTTKGAYTDANWASTAVTYNTMPGISGDNYPNIDLDHASGETLLLGTINYTGGTTGEINMESTPALVDFINADANGAVTFFLEPQVATSEGQDFSIDIIADRRPLVGAEIHPTLTIENHLEILELGSVTLEQLPGTNGLALTWATTNGLSYAVQRTSDLVLPNWTNDTSGIVGIGGSMTITTAVDQAQCFYRIVLE